MKQIGGNLRLRAGRDYSSCGLPHLNVSGPPRTDGEFDGVSGSVPYGNSGDQWLVRADLAIFGKKREP